MEPYVRRCFNPTRKMIHAQAFAIQTLRKIPIRIQPIPYTRLLELAACCPRQRSQVLSLHKFRNLRTIIM